MVIVKISHDLQRLRGLLHGLGQLETGSYESIHYRCLLIVWLSTHLRILLANTRHHHYSTNLSLSRYMRRHVHLCR